jgi:hypothetical protein
VCVGKWCKNGVIVFVIFPKTLKTVVNDCFFVVVWLVFVFWGYFSFFFEIHVLKRLSP